MTNQPLEAVNKVLQLPLAVFIERVAAIKPTKEKRMPNHVTNIIEASPSAIKSMLNEHGLVDFCQIIPKHSDLDLDGSGAIHGDSENAAELMCKEPPSNNELIARLELVNRLRSSALQMSNESFEQFVMMMRNKRKHGFYHCMDYARNAWGTKWNAYSQSAEDNTDSRVTFETAWSHPYPVIEALSKKFPDEIISIKYADEDTGSNCGTYTIKNGEVIEQNIAPSWKEQTTEQKRFFTEFAFRLCHPDTDPRQYGYDENFEYDEAVEEAFSAEQKSA